MKSAVLLESEREVLNSLLVLMTENPFGVRHESIRQGLARRGRKDYRPVNLVGGHRWRVREARLILENPSCGQRQLVPEDRHLAKRALLVVLFHRYAERFDDYIDRVEAEGLAPGEPSPQVDFAEEVWAYLREHGFLGTRGALLSEEEALHIFALVYQLCRASRFISEGLVGECPSMQRLRMNLWNNVFTHDLWQYAECLYDRMEDFSTLILGGTGSGKGTAAGAIGFSGFIEFDRQTRCFKRAFRDSFVATVLAQYPAGLIESAIFGHEKGAFTGAAERQAGVLDRCMPAGVVFLDEIGEIDHHVQVKLLQVLQERHYTRVGGQERRRFNGRVVAATNRPLEELLGRHVLRPDFFYRLCSDVIEMPSFRQRVEEDPGELDRMLRHTVRGIIGPAVAEGTAARLVADVAGCIRGELGPDYDWPGNVRELEQCVRSYLIRKTCRGIVVPRHAPETPNHEPLRIPEALLPMVAAIRDRTITRDELFEGYAKWVFKAQRNYKAVARALGVKDARTIKKYLETPANSSGDRGRDIADP